MNGGTQRAPVERLERLERKPIRMVQLLLCQNFFCHIVFAVSKSMEAYIFNPGGPDSVMALSGIKRGVKIVVTSGDMEVAIFRDRFPYQFITKKSLNT